MWRRDTERVEGNAGFLEVTVRIRGGREKDPVRETQSSAGETGSSGNLEGGGCCLRSGEREGSEDFKGCKEDTQEPESQIQGADGVCIQERWKTG